MLKKPIKSTYVNSDRVVNEGKQLTDGWLAAINYISTGFYSKLQYTCTLSADQVLESNGTLGLVPICFWNYYIISILRNICIDRYDHLIRPKEKDI